MSETQNTVELDQAIASLKKQADRLGITYKSNVSMATLQKAIQDKMNQPIGGEDSAPEPTATETKPTKSARELEEDRIRKLHNDAMKLVRVIITPMDSLKAANMDSDVFCAGNSVLGTVKRVIPFGVEWHVEQILLNTIREKKFQLFTSKKNARGATETTARLVPAYNITELPPLTQEELDKLADHQIRTRSLEDEE